MKLENREDLLAKFTQWLSDSVRELHLYGARGTGHERPCFNLESLLQRVVYSHEENARSLHISYSDGLLKVVVIVRDIERPAGIEVMLRYKSGGLIDSKPLELSGSNPREMTAELRFAPYGPALVLEFVKAD